MSHILVCGIITLDIIQYVENYPLENSEQRASQQIYQSGGNAANSSYILKQLGHEPKLATTLAGDTGADFLRQQLESRQIHYVSQWLYVHHQSPTSCITVNQHTASRTIIHYRDLPELSFELFDTLDLHKFDWFHFEGRNINEQLKIIQKCLLFNKHISVEAEKDRPNIDILFNIANIIFFSQAFAQARGFTNAKECLFYFAQKHPHAILFCAWGSSGASALQHNKLYHSPAFPPNQLLDTLAAGDTFNAACIDGLLKKQSLETVLMSACKIAGKKCGQVGLDDLLPI